MRLGEIIKGKRTRNRKAPNRSAQASDLSVPIRARTSIYSRFSTDEDTRWAVIGASVPSREKTKAGRRCDDYCHFAAIFEGCGAIFVADGVGSVPMSRFGSELLCRFVVPRALKTLVEDEAKIPGLSPSEFLHSIAPSDWARLSQCAVGAGYDALERLARKTRHPTIAFSSTLIVCLILSRRILLFHLGDGRGAVRTENTHWQALFEPNVVEGIDDRSLMIGSVQSVVHDLAASAVSVMTDGCERAAFLTRVLDEDSGKYVGQNKPYGPFFDAVPPYVRDLARLEEGQREAWTELLRKGTPKLEEEADDKTLVVAVRLTGAR
jgi:hypothetical protein